jgi:hypothetical protein
MGIASKGSDPKMTSFLFFDLQYRGRRENWSRAAWELNTGGFSTLEKYCGK